MHKKVFSALHPSTHRFFFFSLSTFGQNKLLADALVFLLRSSQNARSPQRGNFL
jgi:hypothetical protein